MPFLSVLSICFTVRNAFIAREPTFLAKAQLNKMEELPLLDTSRLIKKAQVFGSDFASEGYSGVTLWVTIRKLPFDLFYILIIMLLIPRHSSLAFPFSNTNVCFTNLPSR